MSCCGKIVHGAVGLTKAALHVGMGEPEVVSRRRTICRGCEHSEKRKVMGRVLVRMCGKCGCLIGPKTVIRSERCPVGLW
jgi:hypothetical protein